MRTLHGDIQVLKVLHIITRLDPGGSSDICVREAEFLREKGCSVFTASGVTEHTPEGVIPLRFLKREINPVWDFLAVAEIYFLCRRIKPDILHLHTSKAGMAGRIAGSLAGVGRIFYQPHGIVFYGYFSRFKSRLILCAERLLARLAEKIIVLTREAGREFLEYRVGKSRQYAVLENGVDTEIFNEIPPCARISLRESLGIEGSEFVLGMAGRLVPLKGHRFFLEAFARLSAEVDSLRGVIIGDGPEMPGLLSLSGRLGIKEKVLFTGYRKDMDKAVHLMDLLVQPSLVEGFGLTLIEAGASGIPAIGFSVGGIKDIIDDGVTGILVKKEDTEGLYRAMRSLYFSQERVREMGRKARERVCGHFTLEMMRDRLYGIYGIGE